MSTTTTTITHQLSFNKKRVLLRRSTQQINDPIVIKQKYKAKKSVHFADNDQVRYFYKSHTPKQIHQEPPYMEYSVDDYKLLQPNWPSRNSLIFNDNKVRMESIQLVDGDYNTMSRNQFVLEGRCRAFNMSFEKAVHIRYTTDLWKSYQEIQAQFHESIQSTSHTWDRFFFHIPIQADLETKTIYMAIRYTTTVDGQDHWDNNHGKNYQVIIQPNEQQETKKEDIKVLAKRYDFTASLSAASTWSPPPSPPRTPTDDNPYTPPIFFHNTAKQPSFDDDYTDFVNKYCFYNSHTTPIYSTTTAILS